MIDVFQKRKSFRDHLKTNRFQKNRKTNRNGIKIQWFLYKARTISRSEPHKNLFFMIFHDKNTWRYGLRFSKNIPQNKVFNKVFSQNDIECYRFKKGG